MPEPSTPLDRRRQPDRRRLPTRNEQGGRRATDPEPSHGTRVRYRRGCRCTACRAANAAYWTDWRKGKRGGRVPLGALISAAEAHRIIKVLRAEFLTRQRLAEALGRHHDLARLTHQQMITVRTLLKVRRVYRTRMLEPGHDAST
jgi:hypothetical protein